MDDAPQTQAFLESIARCAAVCHARHPGSSCALERPAVGAVVDSRPHVGHHRASGDRDTGGSQFENRPGPSPPARWSSRCPSSSLLWFCDGSWPVGLGAVKGSSWPRSFWTTSPKSYAGGGSGAGLFADHQRPAGFIILVGPSGCGKSER